MFYYVRSYSKSPQETSMEEIFSTSKSVRFRIVIELDILAICLHQITSIQTLTIKSLAPRFYIVTLSTESLLFRFYIVIVLDTQVLYPYQCISI